MPVETCNMRFDETIITCTDQNGGLVELEDKVNLAFLINK